MDASEQARKRTGREETAVPVATQGHAARSPRLHYRLGERAEECFTLVVVPPCRFTMGSPATEPGRGAGETQHEVHLTRAYAIATTPVTQALYAAVTGTNPSRFDYESEAPACPADRVGWLDALRFCNALSVMLGLRPVYAIQEGDGGLPDVREVEGADGFRLPTEAEWECAARAGGSHRFAGGDQPDAVAWTDENSGFRTHPVGRLAANAWGLHDMSGNVWEWTSDGLGPYPSGIAIDPRAPARWADRVMRGGSCWSPPEFARAANRTPCDQGNRLDCWGLRVARTILEP